MRIYYKLFKWGVHIGSTENLKTALALKKLGYVFSIQKQVIKC